jgi:hypothetical protein
MAFDSGGAFNSDSKSETTNTTQNSGFSEIGGGASSIQLTGGYRSPQTITVNQLDSGAIARAFDFAGSIANDALHQVELAGSNAKSTVTEAVQAVSESARSETENILIQGAKWAVIAVIAVAGFYALSKLKG